VKSCAAKHILPSRKPRYLEENYKVIITGLGKRPQRWKFDTAVGLCILEVENSRDLISPELGLDGYPNGYPMDMRLDIG